MVTYLKKDTSSQLQCIDSNEHTSRGEDDTHSELSKDMIIRHSSKE